MISLRIVAVLIMAVTVLSGCVQSLQRAHDALEADAAAVAGYSGIRAYRDARIDEAPENVNDWAPKAGSNNLDFLMISGGGAGGAFTVGVLAAWTDTQSRPNFDVVTGVSTGALIAPYAFLGSAYDGALIQLYTSGVAEDLVAPKGPLGLLGSSLLKSEPLRQMVERFITPAVLDQIASEHRKGRRLLVLTTNLDSQRAVVWNMGAIAASGHPDALKLFQDVMLASASIPGVYPAVTIEAETRGRQFVELHSDGGAASQVSILPQALLTSTNSLRPSRKQKANFYVIVNNALMPEFGLTTNKTISVMAKAYSIFLKSQAQSELVALHSYAKRTGAGFHLATINAQVPYSMLDPFDTDYMRAVYDLGYKGTVAGTLWKDTPLFR
ncbi:MAG: alpha/beta hydrolase [Mesorhizobium sp.]|uniref:patatin-like phospholipase family protein n=1 Tax=Mesorhizobium sp. TaxID=1871066 RepID=UPI000FE57901|nr:patatin-like phospholipase family protein [Mesorhizobium sp.]RWI57300.1 MAG: alpha/beta hydrolase [Mesorhizobium sp.]